MESEDEKKPEDKERGRERGKATREQPGEFVRDFWGQEGREGGEVQTQENVKLFWYAEGIWTFLVGHNKIHPFFLALIRVEGRRGG